MDLREVGCGGADWIGLAQDLQHEYTIHKEFNLD
jgi:hypothetical protein